MFGFEKLDAWQMSVDFADLIYSSTSRFPDAERFGLTSQLRRASVSISSNIAEGSSRSSDIEFLRFVEIGYGSLMECVSQSFIATRQSFLAESQRQSVYQQAERLARVMSGLRGHLLSKNDRH